MPQITKEMIHASYRIAKRIYEDKITDKYGKDYLVKNHQMNRNSATGYIHNYSCMLEGRLFTRTSNAYGARYFLRKIHADSGRTALLNSLSALWQHIDYYEPINNVRLRAQRKIYDEFSKIAELEIVDEVEIVEIFPDEVSENNTELLEGKTKKVSVNIYERNPIARQKCIERYGCKCVICGFNFEKIYGDIGKSFIHVHHLIEISDIGKEYTIDAIKHLRPVCPNCHAMLHKKKPAYTIKEIKQHLKSAR